ncbi:nitroreductase [Niallia circulans]|uniref:Nitroreductase n=1 Tax=Niallia circulans TaxID=1397 RepID=A0A0J1IIG9_NIACI|nr:nitroreductase [Niallia circulans]KLV25749.1 nitroreductase [Niallia circulans]MCM2979561.1 nitroreductase [Niallia circulans]MDR4315820.1 nitroreductase [Niallia circulans]MED3836930.1 nitroreductase [Niallia circulans]MED4244921.1 nitroreductase [Niallia circulans]
MNIAELITGRRTVKKFKTKDVENAIIIEWLQQAKFAPNHRMTEPWRILFVGENTRAELKHKTNFGGASKVIAVLSHKGRNQVERDENLAAVSCFIQNFMLQAWDAGVGTFWSSVGSSALGRNTLGVSEDYEVVGVLAIGYPEEIMEPKARTSIEEKITYLD